MAGRRPSASVPAGDPGADALADILGTPVVGATGSEADVRSWIARALEVRRAASLAAIDGDTLVGTIVVALSEAPRTHEASELSEGDHAVLGLAGVDLRGPDDAVDDPIVRTSTRAARLMAEALTTAELAARTRLTPGRIRQRITAGALYAVAREGEWRIPVWQLDGDALVPGLERVLPRLAPGLHPLAVENLMTTPMADLDVDGVPMSPVAWLLSGGDPDRVAESIEWVPVAS